MDYPLNKIKGDIMNKKKIGRIGLIFIIFITLMLIALSSCCTKAHIQTEPEHITIPPTEKEIEFHTSCTSYRTGLLKKTYLQGEEVYIFTTTGLKGENIFRCDVMKPSYLQIYSRENEYVGTIALGKEIVNIFEPNEQKDGGERVGTAVFSHMFIMVYDKDGDLSAVVGKNMMAFPYFIEFYNNNIGRKTVIALIAFDQELQKGQNK